MNSNGAARGATKRATLEAREADLNEDVQMDVMERIKTQLSAAPVVLFMKGTPDFPQCGFSAQAVAALRACGATFNHVNIFEDPELREALKRYSNWPTYPQLYVNGELIGGCDIVLEMYKSGELRSTLNQATVGAPRHS
jgi:monothiol glutaredoxin